MHTHRVDFLPAAVGAGPTLGAAVVACACSCIAWWHTMRLGQVVAECIAINSLLQHPHFPFPTVPFPIHVGQSVVTHRGPLRIGDVLEVELKPGTCEASDR